MSKERRAAAAAADADPARPQFRISEFRDRNHRMHTMRHTFGIAALAFMLTPIAAQIPPAQKPSFSVVSIKANKSGNRIVLPTASPGGRFSATNVWLRSLLQFSYRPRNGLLMRNQIVGGPSWMDTDQFDIEAKAERSEERRVGK